MAAKESRTFEITLNGIDLKKSGFVKSGHHLVTVELLCPRPQVAAKSAVRTYKFKTGALECGTLPWVKRVYFKESVEFRFGLCVRVSESVAQTYMVNFLRYFAGAAFGLAADEVENSFPGPSGDIAAIPLDYAKRKLVSARAAKIISEGAVDLMPSELEDSCEIEIPLCATEDIFSAVRKGISGHGNTASSTRKLLHAEGDVIGAARLQLTVLK